VSRFAKSWERVDNANNALQLPRRVPATRSSATQRASSASGAARATNLVQAPPHEFQVPPPCNTACYKCSSSACQSTCFKCHHHALQMPRRMLHILQVKVQAQTKCRPSPDQVPTKLQERRTVAQRCRLRPILRIIQKCQCLFI